MNPIIKQLGVVSKQLLAARESLTQRTEDLEHRLEQLLSDEVVAFKQQVVDIQGIIDNMSGVVRMMIDAEESVEVKAPTTSHDNSPIIAAVNNLQEIGKRMAQVSEALGRKVQAEPTGLVEKQEETPKVPGVTIKTPWMNADASVVSDLDIQGSPTVKMMTEGIMDACHQITHPAQAAGSLAIKVFSPVNIDNDSVFTIQTRSLSYTDQDSFREWLMLSLRGCPQVAADRVAVGTLCRIVFTFNKPTVEAHVDVPEVQDLQHAVEMPVEKEMTPVVSTRVWFEGPTMEAAVEETPNGSHDAIGDISVVSVSNKVCYEGLPAVQEVASTIISSILQNLGVLTDKDLFKKVEILFSRTGDRVKIINNEILGMPPSLENLTQYIESKFDNGWVEAGHFVKDVEIKVTIFAGLAEKESTDSARAVAAPVGISTTDNPYRGHYVGAQSVFANYLSGRHYVGGRGALSINNLPLYESAISTVTLEKLAEWPTGFYIAENGDYQFLMKINGGSIIVTDFGNHSENKVASEAPCMLIKGELIDMDSVSPARLPAIMNFIEQGLMKLVSEVTGIPVEQLKKADVTEAEFDK